MNVILILILMLLVNPVWSANFDIEAYCKQVSKAVGGSYQIEQTCRDQQREAQANLAGMSIPSEIKNHCEQVGNVVGGSYKIMETCVEQEIKAKANLH